MLSYSEDNEVPEVDMVDGRHHPRGAWVMERDAFEEGLEYPLFVVSPGDARGTQCSRSRSLTGRIV